MSNAGSHAAVRSVSGISRQFAICMAKRHSTYVGGIFMHVLAFQENVCALVSGRPGIAHVKSQGFQCSRTVCTILKAICRRPAPC